MASDRRENGDQAAFEGQRPPFEPGHTLSTKHAAYSPRQLAPLAAKIEAEIREILPAGRNAADATAVELLAWNLARIRQVYAWIAEQPGGLFRGGDDDGAPQPVLRDL